MSMNLYIKHNGTDVEVWQTPTYITNMCLMTHTGIKWEVKGKEADRAIRCYIEYVKSKLSGSFEVGEYADVKKSVLDHTDKIAQLIGVKGVKVYTL